MQICSKLEGLVKRFGTCQGGAIAVLYAVSAVPFLWLPDLLDYPLCGKYHGTAAALDRRSSRPQLRKRPTRSAGWQATFVMNLEMATFSRAITRSFEIEDDTVVAAADMEHGNIAYEFAGMSP
jgi:hypothetical protein